MSADHRVGAGRRRRYVAASIVLVTALAVLAVATAAHAQFPPILPAPGIPGGSSQAVSSPAGEAHAYAANPSRTNASAELNLAGPLEKAWAVDLGGANQPLVAGDRVLVNFDSGSEQGVVALDPRTGTEIWRHLTGGQATPLAADSGIVVAADTRSDVRAYSVGDGGLIWYDRLGQKDNANPVAAPVAADGTAYVLIEDTASGDRDFRAVALSLADGSIRWDQPVEIVDAELALDDERLFISNGRQVVALRRADGLTSWSRVVGDETMPCGFGFPAVYGGELYIGNCVHDAATGIERRRLPIAPETFTGGLGIATSPESVEAISLEDGSSRWRRAGVPTLDAIAVPGTVYVADRAMLNSIEPSTGRQLWAVRRPKSALTIERSPGITAAGGILMIGEGTRLTAFRSVLTPSPRGTAVGATAFDVLAGKRIGVAGLVGHELRASAPSVELQADRFPFRRARVVARQRSFEDGSSRFDVRIRKNTRLRVAVPGGPASPAFVAYAYPKFKFRFRAVSPRFALANMKIRRIPSQAVKGRRLHLYLKRHGSGRHRRIGSSRVRTKTQTGATAKVRFRRLKRLGRKDLFVVCVRGLARRGYGRNVGLQRACGKKIVRVRAPRKAVAERRLKARPGAGHVVSTLVGQ